MGITEQSMPDIGIGSGLYCIKKKDDDNKGQLSSELELVYIFYQKETAADTPSHYLIPSSPESPEFHKELMNIYLLN